MSYADDVIRLILKAKASADVQLEVFHDRERALYMDYKLLVRDDSVTRESNRLAKEWQDVVRRAAEELLVCGTLLWKGTSEAGGYWVVERVDSEGNIRAFPVTVPLGCRKHSDLVCLTDSTRLVQLEDIPDVDVRRAAKKLIVRVRTKDWKVGG